MAGKFMLRMRQTNNWKLDNCEQMIQMNCVKSAADRL